MTFLWPHGHQAHISMRFPSKNTGVGCHFLPEGTFPTQGSSPHLLHGRWVLYHWATREARKKLLSSVQLSHSVVSNSLRPNGPKHARPPCPSPTPRVHPDSCPLSQWCHPTISSSVIPFSSRLQSFPASGSFQMSQLFTSGGQSIGVSASTSVLPMNIQDWFPLEWKLIGSSCSPRDSQESSPTS